MVSHGHGCERHGGGNAQGALLPLSLLDDVLGALGEAPIAPFSFAAYERDHPEGGR